MISMDRKYRTRDGREVRIYAVGGRGKFSVHGAFNDEDDGWTVETWTIDGQFDPAQRNSQFDLIEVRPKITRTYWFCHTANENNCNGYGWTDKAEAEKWARQVNRTVSITGPHEITFEEGEGLPSPSTPKEP